MTRQLSFDYPASVSLGGADFFVSDANRQAWAMVMAPDTWPQGKLALSGPRGSGKTHLARVFAAQTGAVVLQAADLPADLLPPGPVVVIEDMEHLPPGAQAAVFHLHNHLHATGGRLLLTAATPPARWPLTLSDLASRMHAATHVGIRDPDDALLAAVIMKQFADRQIAPAPDLATYLAPRIERSFSAVAAIVAALDAAALTSGKPVTRHLARTLLDKHRAALR